jgi:hypothetical protein
MNGLPEGTDLTFLLNRELIQVCVGLYQVILNFDGKVSISIEGDFIAELKGRTAKRGKKLPMSASVLLDLLGQRVEEVQGSADGTLSLKLGHAATITIFDSNREFESYQIWNGTELIVV